MLDKPWLTFDPLTRTYKTGDGTQVAEELTDNVQCFADILHIANIREEQRLTHHKPMKGNESE